MRDDWPRDAGEDFVEPPCEIFFQLFIGNAGFLLNEDEGEAEVQADDNDNSNDSILSYPSIHTMSDTSLPGFGGEHSSDEGGNVNNEAQCVEPSNEGEGVGNSVSDISLISLESWSDYSEPGTEDSDPYEPEVIYLDNNQSDQETVANDFDNSPEPPEGPEPEVECASKEVMDDSENRHSSDSPSSARNDTSDSEHSFLEATSSSANNESKAVKCVARFVPLSDDSDEWHDDDLNPKESNPHPSNYFGPITDDSDESHDNDLNPKKNTPHYVVSLSDDSEESHDNGSSHKKNVASVTSCKSLVPHIDSYNHDSDDSCDALGTSPDGFFSALGLRPLNPPSSPASTESEDKNMQSVDTLEQNSSKASNGLDTLASASSAVASSTVQENANTAKLHSLSELNLAVTETFNYSNDFDSSDSKSPDSVSENLNSTDSDSKLETANCFIDNIQSEFSTYDDNLPGGCDIVLENSSGIMLDKPVPSLKRKICSSSDDSVMSKVPKCSSEEASNESVNQGSLENYCKMYNSPDNSTSSSDDQMDNVPSSATKESMIVTVEKPLEKASVIEKPTFQ